MIRKKNYIHQLADYIIKNLSKGYTIEALKWALINQGYSKIAVEKAITITHEKLSKSAPKMIEKPEITYEIVDENNNQISQSDAKKSFWKKLFGD